MWQAPLDAQVLTPRRRRVAYLPWEWRAYRPKWHARVCSEARHIILSSISRDIALVGSYCWWTVVSTPCSRRPGSYCINWLLIYHSSIPKTIGSHLKCNIRPCTSNNDLHNALSVVWAHPSKSNKPMFLIIQSLPCMSARQPQILWELPHIILPTQKAPLMSHCCKG